MANKAVLEAEDADFETSEDVEIVPSFDSMGLKDELLRGISLPTALRSRLPSSDGR